ncbi:MAG: hypothetical protein ACOYJG_07965 [Prevotella sp.]
MYNLDSLVEDENARLYLVISSKVNGTTRYSSVSPQAVKLQKSDDDTYYIHQLVNIPVFSDYSDPSDGNLTVTAMLATQEIAQKCYNNLATGSNSTVNTKEFPFDSNKQIFIPLYSNTKNTKVTKNDDGYHMTASFYMLGSVVTTTFTGNPLAFPVHIDGIKLTQSNSATGNFTWTMGTEDSDGNPVFTMADESTCELGWTDNSTDVIPSDFYYTSNNLEKKTVQRSAWVLPKSGDNTDVAQDIRIKYNLVLGDTIFPTETVARTGKGTISGGFKNGYAYYIKVGMPKSDLMFTEMEHDNAGGYNYTMVELFNPTASPIDLRYYKIVKYTGFQDANETVLGYEGIDDNGTAKWITDLAHARTQDLYIDAGTTDMTDEWAGPTNCSLLNGTAAGDYYTNSYVIFDAQNSTETSFRTFPQKQTYTYTVGGYQFKDVELEPWQLGPGQTIIVAASKVYLDVYYNDRDDSKWHTNSGYFNNHYLDNAAKAGVLKYAMAADNGYYSWSGSEKKDDWASNHPYGGVMQHAMRSGFELYRVTSIKLGETRDFEFVDDVMHPSASEGAWAVWKDRIFSTGEIGTYGDDCYAFSRYPSVMYPSSKNSVYYKENSTQYDNPRETTTFLPENTSFCMYDWRYWFGGENFNMKLRKEFGMDVNTDFYSPGTRFYVEEYDEPNS